MTPTPSDSAHHWMKRWQEEHDARKAAEAERDEAQTALTGVRERLVAAGVPTCAFVDDHVAALIAQRDEACAARDGLLDALRKERKRVKELEGALEEGRRAIGDHFAPNDCYATGPLTGDPIRDLVECPACSFILKYEAVKEGGENGK